MDLHLKELEDALRPFKNAKRAKGCAHIMCTPLQLWGVPVCKQRNVLKKGFSFSTGLQHARDHIFEKLFHLTDVHEIGNLALIHFQDRRHDLTMADWPRLKRLAARVNNWEHADRLASLIAELHEQHPRSVYPTLKAWNQDANAWLRRLSLTSLFYYSRERKTQPNLSLVLPLVESLISDPNAYIQKAVGWTLRECHNAYPKDTVRFLQKNALKLSATAFSYATEKLPADLKKKLLEIRKTKRKH